MSRGFPCLEIRDGDIPIDRENEEADRDRDGVYNATHDRESHLARANLDENGDQSPEDQDARQICRDEFLERQLSRNHYLPHELYSPSARFRANCEDYAMF